MAYATTQSQAAGPKLQPAACRLQTVDCSLQPSHISHHALSPHPHRILPDRSVDKLATDKLITEKEREKINSEVKSRASGETQTVAQILVAAATAQPPRIHFYRLEDGPFDQVCAPHTPHASGDARRRQHATGVHAYAAMPACTQQKILHVIVSSYHSMIEREKENEQKVTPYAPLRPLLPPSTRLAPGVCPLATALFLSRLSVSPC